MVKNRKALWLIFILIVIAIGILIKVLIPKHENLTSGEIVDKDSLKNITFNQKVESIDSLIHSPAKVYSLEKDKKYEKELLKKQHDNLVDKINLDSVSLNLKSNKEQKRLNAVKILSYFPDNSYISIIENLLLNDSSPEVRGQCAVTLQLLDSKSSISTLIKALNDQDGNVKIYSTLALAALGEKEKSFSIADSLWNNGKSDAPFYSCHMAFRDIDTPDAADRLIYDLNNNDKFVAIDAAIILAQLGYPEEAFPFLEQSLSHDDKYIRMAALRGLAYIGDQKSLELINSRINDPNNLVRERVNSIIMNFNK